MIVDRIDANKRMSLRAPLVYCIPDETARGAHAAFLRGNPYMRMGDTLSLIYTDPEFAHLFLKTGQPAEAPAQRALVTVMQFSESLSDTQAADAVRSRIDWKMPRPDVVAVVTSRMPRCSVLFNVAKPRIRVRNRSALHAHVG